MNDPQRTGLDAIARELDSVPSRTASPEVAAAVQKLETIQLPNTVRTTVDFILTESAGNADALYQWATELRRRADAMDKAADDIRARAQLLANDLREHSGRLYRTTQMISTAAKTPQEPEHG